MAVTGNVLVLRALGLGDLLVAVPALRALRTAYPDARITLATPAALGELVELTGAVDAVLDTPRLDLLRWQEEPPALAVNLHGRGPESTRQLLRVVRPARLLAHADPVFPTIAGPPWRTDVSEVDRWCDLLRWHGVPADADDLLLPAPAVPGPAPGAVVVHPGAAFAARRWPVDRFGRVARALADDGHHVMVTGNADERPLADAVVAAAARTGVRAAGPTSLTDLAALVADAALVVCGDTGVGHLATAYRVPSVLLFGPTPPDCWGPTVDRDRHVVLWRGETGDPFGAAPTPGLLRIDVPDVITCARELLARTAHGRVPEGVGHG